MKALLFLFVPLLCAQEKVDLSVINRIKTEALQNSKVMDHAFYLTDVYGPRLSGSPALKQAAEWTMKQMNEWGLSNVRLEPWGPYGRGWSCTRFSAHMRTPEYAPLIGFARPLSPGTKGLVKAEPILAVIRNEADMERYKGKLKGKIVLLESPPRLAPQSETMMKRYTAAELEAQAMAPEPAPPAFPAPFAPDSMRMNPLATPGQPMNREALQKLRNRINEFLVHEGVLVVLTPSYRTDGGTVFASAAGSRDPKDPLPPPSVALTSEHYNRIARLLAKKIPVTLEFDIENQIYEPADSFNVTAELPGGGKKDEVVLLGAHLDSWTGGTGATDDASGVAVVMEAMRILKALDLKMPRTVRAGLWSAEEQGLLGSKAYVTQHYGDSKTMQLKPEHAKLCGYFNLDNGTGKIRGVYLQGNDMMRPIFEAWLAPLKDMGAATVTIRNTGGTDHLPFDAVGLPAFQFIQDPVEYMTRTHHSNMDVYDRLQPGDLMQASAILASVAYDAATRDGMLPRKPLPKPEGSKKQQPSNVSFQ